ncbi:hypothetical protein ACYF6T_10230 [Streptomyces sp. 7R007]
MIPFGSPGPYLSYDSPCEPVWATTWMDEANALVAPWLGLPPLPPRPLVDWARGRSFVWVDDEITDADRAWVAGHHPGAALVHRVDHRYGLTGAGLELVAAWVGGSPARL